MPTISATGVVYGPVSLAGSFVHASYSASVQCPGDGSHIAYRIENSFDNGATWNDMGGDTFDGGVVARGPLIGQNAIFGASGEIGETAAASEVRVNVTELIGVWTVLAFSVVNG